MNILGLNSLGGGGLLSQMADRMLVSSRNPVLMPNVRQLMPGQNNLLNPSSQMSNRLGSLSSDPLQASLLGLPGTGVGFDVSQVPTSVPNIPGVSADQALVNAFTPAPKTRSSGIGGFLSNMSPEMAFGIASSLLQGPTALPVSTGKKLTSGLLTGMQLQRQAEQDKLTNLLTGAKITEALGKGGEKQFSQEKDLRTAFDKDSKTFKEAVSGFKKVEQAALSKDATGVDDLALIFGYMKTIDPTSVVREGEFANAENSGGVGNRVRNLYNSVLFGNRLTDEQRKNFYASAKGQLTSQYEAQKAVENRYVDLANSYGLDSGNIVTDFLPSGFKLVEEGSDLDIGDPGPQKGETMDNPRDWTGTAAEGYASLPAGTFFKIGNDVYQVPKTVK